MVNSGDTAFVLIASALVLLMTPGLALFYGGGAIRSKNVLSTMSYGFFAMGLVLIQWVLFGYSLAFSDSGSQWIGDLQYFALQGVGGAASAGRTIPDSTFMIYQAMFAVITVALISGAYVERMKFSAYILFTLLWSTFVYIPTAHWVWGSEGVLASRGAIDFAGGTVVHLASGVSALVVASYLGKRSDPTDKVYNPILVLIGGALLWFGWNGFNAGSALGANELASYAFVNTNVAAATAAVVWSVIDYIHTKKVPTVGFITGAVAGLVVITPAAGYVTPAASLAIGVIAGLGCYGGVFLKKIFKYDDSLDAFGVHGVGGFLGALLTGLFATKLINPAGPDGLFYGNPKQLLIQFVAVIGVAAFSAAMTYLILLFTDYVIRVRPSKKVEQAGLDEEFHGEVVTPGE